MLRQAEYRIVPNQEIVGTILFPLSWGRDIEPLKKSIGRIGLVSPLVLRNGRDGLELICGRRRLEALRDLGRSEFPALVLPESVADEEALVLALEENLGHRMFNDAEKVLALTALARFFDRDRLTSQYLPLLGLPPRGDVLEEYLQLADLGPEGLDALARGDMDPETGVLLLSLSASDRQAVQSLLIALTPGRNKRRELLTWLTEIGRREDLPLDAVLADPAVREALTSDKLPRPQKEKKIRELLRRRRRPVQSRLEDRRLAAIKSLGLPVRIRLTPPQNFEGLEFALEMTFADAAELRENLECLARLAQSEELTDLLEIG